MADVYDDIAGIYDECGISEFSLSFGEGILEYFNRMYPNETFKKNLDIFCGTGTLCNFFKENGIETKGVDISKEMLDVARGKYPDIEFVECDVMEYQDDEIYDFVTATDDALPHIIDLADIKKIIRNVNKYLRVNGLFVFDVNYFYQIPFEKYDKDIGENRRLSYHPQREGELVRLDIEYYEDDVLLWKHEIYERDSSIEDFTRILNEEGFIIESCSQHFFNEKRSEKWKIVAKKIE